MGISAFICGSASKGINLSLLTKFAVSVNFLE
jgi:hypothetical protein